MVTLQNQTNIHHIPPRVKRAPSILPDFSPADELTQASAAQKHVSKVDETPYSREKEQPARPDTNRYDCGTAHPPFFPAVRQRGIAPCLLFIGNGGSCHQLGTDRSCRAAGWPETL